MIHDLADGSAPELPTYDLCVVGTGPAGATLVNELAATGLRIAVLESGRRAPTARGDALRAVESDGIAIKPWSRERVLGGASTTWGGLSSMLDPVDLAPRSWIGSAGWPLAHAALLELYAEAARRYEFPLPAEYGPDGFGRLRARGDWQPRWRRLEEKIFLARSPAQDFGRTCAAAWTAPNVDLLLDATAVELFTQPERRDALPRVEAVRVRTTHGELLLRTRACVLATGGIENARLLLLSRAARAAGLGNEYGRVGSGLMNHPKNYFGVVELTSPIRHAPYFFGSLHAGCAGYAGLRLREETQRELGLVDCYTRFEPMFPWSDDAGVEALVTLVKRSGLDAAVRSRARREVVELRAWSETGDDSELQHRRRGAAWPIELAATIVRHAPAVATYAWFRLGRQRPKVRRVRLRHFMEMAPSDDNRITLSTRCDANGVPLASVSHRPGELDRRSLIELQRVLRDELASSNIGRLVGDLSREDPWPVDRDASHHIGATRMGTDPRTSVVDPDLRLHGASNVWVAGSSVFPTSGAANPTWTIVALSIRLARHLRRVLA